MTLVLERFSAASRPERIGDCQRMRYGVYRDLGLDTADMDHASAVDVDDLDGSADFFAVAEGKRIVGCVRAIACEARAGLLRAEEEFLLEGEFWKGRVLVEGSRFAVLEPYRNGEVPLLLLGALRAYGRGRGAAELVALAIVPDPGRRPDTALGVLRWMRDRVRVDASRARPRPGYSVPELRLADVETSAAADPSALPPMIRMLSNARTTLCALPSYCPRFAAWSFLLVTRIAPRLEASA